MFTKKRRSFLLDDFDHISLDWDQNDNRETLRTYRKFLTQAVAALPARQKEAVQLYYEEGLTMEQAAQRMRVSVSTVWRRLEAAKQFLRMAAKLCMDAGLLR